MLKQRFLRIGLAKIGSKIQNLEIFQKSPNVVFSVKMTTFNFWGQSQFRSKGASKIIFRILSGKAIRFLVTYWICPYVFWAFLCLCQYWGRYVRCALTRQYGRRTFTLLSSGDFRAFVFLDSFHQGRKICKIFSYFPFLKSDHLLWNTLEIIYKVS